MNERNVLQNSQDELVSYRKIEAVKGDEKVQN
jgi:hypothetical protein